MLDDWFSLSCYEKKNFNTTEMDIAEQIQTSKKWRGEYTSWPYCIACNTKQAPNLILLTRQMYSNA